MSYSRYLKLSRGDKIRFSCVRCGRCCSGGPNVALTAFDVCRIARYMGVDWRELKGRYIIAIVADVYAIPVLRGVGEGTCAFLEYKDGMPSCKIYPVRPMRCRLYPFLPGSPGKPGVIYADSYCPGINNGPLVEPPWSVLEEYYKELRIHYEILNKLVFNEGLEPLEALEKLIDMVCYGVK